MKPLARFWKSFDELPGGTACRWEWADRLGDDWPLAASYLRSTGRLVREIPCPSPGGEGCPRRVAKLGDGYTAACGNRPSLCDALDLTRDDLTCLTIDRPKLGARIASILDATGKVARSEGVASIVGAHGVAAGVEIQIVLLIPGPMPVSEETIGSLETDGASVAIVVPTNQSTSAAVRTRLQSSGRTVFHLEDLLCVGDQGLSQTRPATEWLAPLRQRLLSRLKPKEGRVWVLPPDARWEDLTFDFVADEVVNVRFGNETRRFEPDQFGLRSKKTGRPTLGWLLLRSLARQGGNLSWNDASASKTIKKQKQLLSARLRSAFGIVAEPIPQRRGSYEARFVVRDNIPDSSRRRSPRRNFVE